MNKNAWKEVSFLTFIFSFAANLLFNMWRGQGILNIADYWVALSLLCISVPKDDGTLSLINNDTNFLQMTQKTSNAAERFLVIPNHMELC